MRDEVLETIRVHYEYLNDRRKEEIRMYERMKQLENNEVVKEYLNLKSNIRMGCNTLSSDDLIEVAFHGNEYDIDETNNIYVCLGEFAIGQDRVKRYMNVENERDFYLVPLDECNNFEESHKVIIIANKKDKAFYLNNKFREIQLDFLREAVNSNQKRACRKILSKKY